MRIMPDFGSQVDAAKLLPVQGGNGSRQHSAGFLAVLGAALKEAEASAKPAMVSPVAPAIATTEELPGPGDSEQADGWRGAAVALESFISAPTQASQVAEPVKPSVSQGDSGTREVVEQGDGWRELDETPASIPMPSSLTPESLRAAPLGPTQLAQRTPNDAKSALRTAAPVTTPVPAVTKPSVAGQAAAPTPLAQTKLAPAQPRTPQAALQPESGGPAAQLPTVPVPAKLVSEQEVPTRQAPIGADVKPAVKQETNARPEAASEAVTLMQPGIELTRIAAQALTQPVPARPAEAQSVAAKTSEPVTLPSIPAIQQVATPVARTQVVKPLAPRTAESGRRLKDDTAPVAGGPEEPVTTTAAATSRRIETPAAPLPIDVPVKITQVVTTRGHDNLVSRDSAPSAVKASEAAPVADSVPTKPATDAEPADAADLKPATTRARTMPMSVAEPNIAAAGTHASLNAAPARTSEPALAQPQPAAESTPVRTHAEPVAQPKGTERVTIQLPGNDGEMTRIRIAVRGDQVRTTLISSDSATSARLSSQAPELERALAARGFREAEVMVPATANPATGRDGGPAAALSVAASGSSSGEALQGNSRHADGSAGDSRQGTAERDRESPDHRAEHQQPRQGRSHQRARRERAK